ncbi:MADS box interactor-like [Zea mays]|uniref:MADS box interactor-like n=1 Tax=Zea mays TaxID=4577 RepID=A0A1D6HA25_MAIZE|nr:MADS box interactor-like [Zea mays]
MYTTTQIKEDVVDGMTSFMAACLVSIKKTKDLLPDQLQKALRKAISVEKKKSKIWKAWDETKVIYNVASWGRHCCWAT